MQDTAQWYKQTEHNAAGAIFRLLHHWDTSQSGIQAANLKNLRLYSNRDVQSLSIANYAMSFTQANGNNFRDLYNRPNRISLNVVKSCIDTLYSKVGKNKIKPTFLTTGGRLQSRMRARKLNKYMFGVLWDCNAYNIGKMALKDSFIFGDGYVKVLRDKKNRIKLERIFPDEIAVDPADAYYGSPRNMFHRKFVSRDYLLEEFPEFATEINSAKQVNSTHAGAQEDTLLVCEAWHLGKEGRHIIAIDGTCLVDEEYKRERFPIAHIRYTEHSIGYFGTGIAEDLIGIQVEINRLLIHVQESMRMISHPRIFVESGSKVNNKHIVNEIGTFVPYTGTPPIIQVAQAVHPEIFQQIESLYNKAYQIVGISALSARAEKPSGLDSGAALREYNDIETERFACTAQSYEQLYIDLGELICDELDTTPNYEITAQSKDEGLEKLKWSDIRIKKSDYLLHCFPTSAMPQTPALRLKWVQEMLEGGFIDPNTAMDLLDFPDLDAYNQITLAPLRIIHKIIEGIIYDYEYIAPEPYFDLNMCLKLGQAYYAWLLLEDKQFKNDKALDMLRQWNDDVASMLAQATMEMQNALPPVPPTPQELGMPPQQMQLPAA